MKFKFRFSFSLVIALLIQFIFGLILLLLGYETGIPAMISSVGVLVIAILASIVLSEPIDKAMNYLSTIIKFLYNFLTFGIKDIEDNQLSKDEDKTTDESSPKFIKQTQQN